MATYLGAKDLCYSGVNDGGRNRTMVAGGREHSKALTSDRKGMGNRPVTS